MTRLQALTELRDKVKAGGFDAPPSSARAPYFNDFMNIADMALPLGVTGICALAWRAYHQHSLDAAKALHEAVLPGWEWHLGPSKAKIYPYNGSPLKSWSGMADNPARAWLLAILEALIARETE